MQSTQSPFPFKCDPNFNHGNYRIKLKTMNFHSEQKALCATGESTSPEKIGERNQGAQASLRSGVSVYSNMGTNQLSVSGDSNERGEESSVK